MARNRLQQGLRVTFLGLGMNALLASGKLLAGVWGHSHALIADAVESFADIFSSLIVWRGLVVSSQPADEDHPYGHGKAEPMAAAAVAILLLLAAGWIALKAAQEILRPHLAPAPYTLAVLVLVVLVKEAMFRYAHRNAKSIESSAILSDAWHHRSDAITSLAAGIGISVALVGGPGYAAADDVAAIVAAVIIAWNGWRLLRPAMDELMDMTPDSGLHDQVRQVARQTPGVRGVEKCILRKMGYHYYVDMHVEVDPQITVQDGHEIAHRVKDSVRAELPAIHDVLVHVEPSQSRPKESRRNAG